MSASTKKNTATAPHHSTPIGNRISAASTEPAVPMMVTMSGVSPIVSAALATGVLILVYAARVIK